MSAERPGVAIDARNLWKVYHVYHDHGRGWLKSLLFPFVRGDRFSDSFAALRGIDLTVRHGEVLGIIGRNGSGKSTLLRALAAMTPLTDGELIVNGQLRCIMASGVGFDTRLTGRQNVVFGSIAMGISRERAVERMESIIEFAELRDHIDKPTMYYSQGMRSRLALAVALQETPEILILDEALSAGDAGFKEKCRQRIDSICSSGRTVLLATHSLPLMQRACTRAILLEDGQIAAEGDPDEVAASYERSVLGKSYETTLERGETTLAGEERPPPSENQAVGGDGGRQPTHPQPGEGDAMELTDAYLCGEDGQRRTHFARGERLELHLIVVTREPLPQPRISLDVIASDSGVRVTQFGTIYLSAETGQLESFRPGRLDGEYELTVAWPRNPLGSGRYHWSLSFIRWARSRDGLLTQYLHVPVLCPFSSESFTDVTWWRAAILEPETELALRPLASAEVSAPASSN